MLFGDFRRILRQDKDEVDRVRARTRMVHYLIHRIRLFCVLCGALEDRLEAGAVLELLICAGALMCL